MSKALVLKTIECSTFLKRKTMVESQLNFWMTFFFCTILNATELPENVMFILCPKNCKILKGYLLFWSARNSDMKLEILQNYSLVLLVELHQYCHHHLHHLHHLSSILVYLKCRTFIIPNVELVLVLHISRTVRKYVPPC